MAALPSKDKLSVENLESKYSFIPNENVVYEPTFYERSIQEINKIVCSGEYSHKIRPNKAKTRMLNYLDRLSNANGEFRIKMLQRNQFKKRQVMRRAVAKYSDQFRVNGNLRTSAFTLYRKRRSVERAILRRLAASRRLVDVGTSSRNIFSSYMVRRAIVRRAAANTVSGKSLSKLLASYIARRARVRRLVAYHVSGMTIRSLFQWCSRFMSKAYVSRMYRFISNTGGDLVIRTLVASCMERLASVSTLKRTLKFYRLQHKLHVSHMFSRLRRATIECKKAYTVDKRSTHRARQKPMYKNGTLTKSAYAKLRGSLFRVPISEEYALHIKSQFRHAARVKRIDMYSGVVDASKHVRKAFKRVYTARGALCSKRAVVRSRKRRSELRSRLSSQLFERSLSNRAPRALFVCARNAKFLNSI